MLGDITSDRAACTGDRASPAVRVVEAHAARGPVQTRRRHGQKHPRRDAPWECQGREGEHGSTFIQRRRRPCDRPHQGG